MKIRTSSTCSKNLGRYYCCIQSIADTPRLKKHQQRTKTTHTPHRRWKPLNKNPTPTNKKPYLRSCSARHGSLFFPRRKSGRGGRSTSSPPPARHTQRVTSHEQPIAVRPPMGSIVRARKKVPPLRQKQLSMNTNKRKRASARRKAHRLVGMVYELTMCPLSLVTGFSQSLSRTRNHVSPNIERPTPYV